jgi:Arc/MetJ-type ribon-helix-helix transcriptional regulator
MNVNIGEYYEAKLRALIARGVAASKTEALRMAVLAYERQLDEEEERMVVQRLDEEAPRLDKRKFKSLDAVLAKNEIDHKKL